MRDSGSMIESEDHYRALGRAYDVADQLSTLRIMRRENECVVLDNMARFGGQFVKALAVAARCADLANYERLKNAFPNYWENFSEDRCMKYRTE